MSAPREIRKAKGDELTARRDLVRVEIERRLA